MKRKSTNAGRTCTKRGRNGELNPKVKLYSVDDVILVLGDGDFTFARGLMAHRGSGLNLFATSYDSETTVKTKYSNAVACIRDVRAGRGIVLHGVDATKLDQLPQQLQGKDGTCDIPRFFTYIIFNFPHTGQQRVHINRALLLDFFMSARPKLVKAGEVHITLKNRPPYSNWNVEDQAKAAGFVLKERRKFNSKLFPGYQHRTTDPHAKAFEAELCITYTFVVNRSKYPFDPNYQSVVRSKEVAIDGTEEVDEERIGGRESVQSTLGLPSKQIRERRKQKVALSNTESKSGTVQTPSATSVSVVAKQQRISKCKTLWRPFHLRRLGKFYLEGKYFKLTSTSSIYYLVANLNTMNEVALTYFKICSLGHNRH